MNVVKILALALALVLVVGASSAAHAGVPFSFKDAELPAMVEAYSKAASQKFVIDATLHGRASITGADDVSVEEAFNLLSSALAVNSFAIVKQGDTFVVMPARNAGRDLLETSTTLPALKPERLATYIVTLKNASSEDLMRQMRMLPSKDGEMTSIPRGNQLIFVDWTSTLHRIDAVLKELDRPVAKKK